MKSIDVGSNIKQSENFIDFNKNYVESIFKSLNIDDKFIKEHYNGFNTEVILNENLSKFLNYKFRNNYYANSNVLKFLTVIWKCFRIRTDFDGCNVEMYVPFDDSVSTVDYLDNDIQKQHYFNIKDCYGGLQYVDFYVKLYDKFYYTISNIINSKTYKRLYIENQLNTYINKSSSLEYFIYTGELQNKFRLNVENCNPNDYNSEYELLTTNISNIYSNLTSTFKVEIQGARVVIFDSERKTITLQHKSKKPIDIINFAAKTFNSYYYNRNTKFRIFESYDKEYQMIFNHVKY